MVSFFCLLASCSEKATPDSALITAKEVTTPVDVHDSKHDEFPIAFWEEFIERFPVSARLLFYQWNDNGELVDATEKGASTTSTDTSYFCIVATPIVRSLVRTWLPEDLSRESYDKIRWADGYYIAMNKKNTITVYKGPGWKEASPEFAKMYTVFYEAFRYKRGDGDVDDERLNLVFIKKQYKNLLFKKIDDLMVPVDLTTISPR